MKLIYRVVTVAVACLVLTRPALAQDPCDEFARGDNFTVSEDEVAILDVLANDLGENLTIADPGSHPNGMLEIVQDADGRDVIRFTPEENYWGTNVVFYNVTNECWTDGSTMEIYVASVEDPPVAGDDSFEVDAGSSILMYVISNDINVDENDGDVLRVTGVTTPGHGTAEIVGSEEIRYTPDAGFVGFDSFEYTLTDRDGSGTSDTATVTVEVLQINRAPEPLSDTAGTPEDIAVEIAVLVNDSDPDGDDLTVVEASGAANGTLSTDGAVVTYTPASDFFGEDSFNYTVSDGVLTATGTVSVSVTPVNDAPVAQNDIVEIDEDTVSQILVLSNDTDIDSADLTVAAASGASHGSVTTDGESVTYSPDSNFSGSDAFFYTVVDGDGGTAAATVTVTVTPVNDAPRTVVDVATTTEDTALTVEVLLNDTDVEGDALSLIGIPQQPDHGLAAVRGDGQAVLYTPEADYVGEDVFYYTASDGTDQAFGEVRVTVTGLNDGPVAVDDAASVNEDGSIAINVLANDTDTDAGADLRVTNVLPPQYGTAEINADGLVVYTPEANYHGTDEFIYIVDDGQGPVGSPTNLQKATSTATVRMTVESVNDAPLAVDDAVTTVAGTPIRVEVLANDTDVEEDMLEVTAAGGASFGAVSIEDGTAVTYTPEDGFTGTDSFLYTAEDGDRASSQARVSVTVTQNTANEGEISLAFGVASVAPNPTRGPLLISVDMPLASPVRVDVYDAIGRRMRTRETQASAGAGVPLELNLGLLEPGIYTYRVTALLPNGDEVVSGRVTLVR